MLINITKLTHRLNEQNLKFGSQGRKAKITEFLTTDHICMGGGVCLSIINLNNSYVILLLLLLVLGIIIRHEKIKD